MTNGEKFKTADERQKAFSKFCSNGLCAECHIWRKFKKITNCKFIWLELEYKEELKPCPFCGGEATTYKAEGWHYVSCVNDDCIASVSMQSFSSEEEAIDAWNRRAK